MAPFGSGCNAGGFVPYFLVFRLRLYRRMMATTAAIVHATAIHVPEIVPAIMGVKAFFL